MTRTFARIGVLILGMGAGSSSAFGQEAPVPVAGPFSTASLQRFIQGSPRPSGVWLAQNAGSTSGKQRDSILNGGIIGAAIGGIGGSALFVAASGGSDDFRGAMLKVAPLTALGGFAVGALVDALR